MKRFACHDIIPGCHHVFTGADDQSVLDQVIAHAAEDHGLVKPPLALVELVVATTHTFNPVRQRSHLRLVGAGPSGSSDGVTADACDGDGAESATRPNDPTAATTFPQRVPAALPFQRRRQLLRSPEPPDIDQQFIAPTAMPAQAVHQTFRHECALYSGTDGFLAAVVPFIRDGLALCQPVMVAVAEPRLTALREALGPDAELVVLLDMAELGHNPARIIPAWRDFVAGTQGQAIRGVGEPIWAGRRQAEIVECQLHEALLNLAVDPDTPLWLVCPYDVAALERDIIAEAYRSHPHVVGAPRTLERAATVDDDCTFHAMSLFAADLPEPADASATVDVSGGTTGEVATRVFAAAGVAGLPAQRSAKLAAAVDEVAGAGAHNSGSPVSIRLWQDRFALVCEVGDRGRIDDLLVGRGSAMSTQSRDRGIRLANELCDLVQVRSNGSGTTVRMLSWL